MKALITQLLLSLLILSGCSLYQQQSERKQSLFPAMPLEKQGLNIHALQQVQATFLQRQERFQAAIEIRPEQLMIIILSTTGQRLATISSTDGKAELNSNTVIPVDIPLDEILSSFEQIYSTSATLQEKLGKHPDWQLKQQQLSRKFFYKENIYSEIVYTSEQFWTGTIKYINHKHNYQFHIDSTLITP
jgi:hypothetical protein